MNPLYQDELYSNTAVNPASTGAAQSAPVGVNGPPVTAAPPPEKASGLGKFMAALEGFGAGVQGRTPLAVLQQKQRQEERILALKESESFLGDMKNMGDLTAEMQGSEKTSLIETIAAKWEAISPGYGDAVRAVGKRPDLATGLEQYMPYLTEPQRAWAQRDPRGFLKWAGTKDGMEAMNTAADQPHLRKAALKIDGVVKGWQQLLPKDVSARLKEDNVLTDAEIMEVQPQLPEQYRFSEVEKEAIKRSKGAIWGGTGVIHGEKADELMLGKAKKDADVALIKEVRVEVLKKLGIVEQATGGDPIEDIYWANLSEEEKAQVQKETGRVPPINVEDQRTSFEADPEFHRSMAQGLRARGRADLADAEMKQAQQVREQVGPVPGAPGVTFDKGTGEFKMNGKPISAEEVQKIADRNKKAGASNISVGGMNATDAAKTELLNQGIADMAEFKGLIMPDGKIDRSIVIGMNVPGTAGVPGTDSRIAYSLIYNAVEAKLRAESGAAVPEQEVKRMADRFIPSPLDSDETIKSKIRRMEAFLRGSFGRIKGAGEATTPAENKTTNSGWSPEEEKRLQELEKKRK